MTTFRISKRQNFTTVDNTHINDSRLSWKATAILTYLLSKPDNWVVHIKQLATAKKCGIKAVYTGMKELKALGYIEHDMVQGSDGKFIKGQYIVHEIPIENPTPISSKPHTQKGNDVKGNDQKSTLLNTDRIPLPKTDLKLRLPAAAVINDSLKYIITKAGNKDATSSIADELYSLVKPDCQLAIIMSFISGRLKDGVDADVVRASILYANENSKGSAKQYRSYLGKTIEHGWASGYLEIFEQERLEQERLEAQKILALAKQREQEEATRQQERQQQDRQEQEEQEFNSIDKEALDEFIINELWAVMPAFEKKQFKLNRNFVRRLKYREYLKYQQMVNL